MNPAAHLGPASYTASTREPPSLFRRPPLPPRPPSHGPLWPRGVPPSRGGGARPRGGARALNWRGGGSASPPPAPSPVVGPWPWHFVSETPFPAQRALSSEWTHDGAHSTPRGISRFTAAHPLAFLAPRRPRSGPAAAPQGAGMSRGPAAFCSGHHCPAAGRHAGGPRDSGRQAGRPGASVPPTPRTASGTCPRPHPAKFYPALSHSRP